MLRRLLSLVSKTSKKKRKREKEVLVKAENDIILTRTLERTPHGRIVGTDESKLTAEDYAEFIDIVRKFEHDQYKVTKVTYVVNSYLSKRYLDLQKEYMEQGIPIEEVLVFHGTVKSIIASIVKYGFKVGGQNGHPIVHGALFGPGIYTSKDGSSPAQFSYDKCIVACLGLPGASGVNHSIPFQHGNWIIFKSAEQLLPCYIIYFERSDKYEPLLLPSQQVNYNRDAEEDDDVKAADIMCEEIPHAQLSQITVKSIQSQIKNILKVQMNSSKSERGWTLDTENLERMDTLIFLLTNFSEKLPLSKDLKKHNLPGVTIEVRFFDGYPAKPPFIRVITPRLLRFQNGGGGHVTAGGGICMELLTTSGWDPRYTIEGLLQIVHMLLSTKNPAARLDKNSPTKVYSFAEAQEAFTRVARTHNWVP